MNRASICAIVLLLAISCLKNDPRPTVSCLYTLSTFSDETTIKPEVQTYTYNSNGRLDSSSFRNRSLFENSIYLYSAGGRLDKILVRYATLTDTLRVSYGADGKIAGNSFHSLINGNSSGTYTWGNQEVKYAHTLDGFPKPSDITTVTFSGDNVVDKIQVYYSYHGEIVEDFRQQYSDFDSGYNPYYFLAQKLPTIIAISKNNARLVIKTHRLYSQGSVYLTSVDTATTQSTTYNQSNALLSLTVHSSLQNKSMASTYKYSNCD